jgi:hypothetical protein|nr:hypothetical protein [Aeromicrobium sp.]
MSQTHDESQTAHVPGPEVVPTGHGAIDTALERLQRVDELDLSQHPEEFDAIHGVLRESLANAGRDGTDLDSA